MNTLQLQKPFGRLAVWAGLLLLLLLAALEGVARTRFVHDLLSAPRLGTPHRQFEIQADRLAMAAAQGPIECIFLGNSMVWRGFDPEAFAQGYEQANGAPLTCFNFGVDGMPAAAAGQVATWLVQTYQPRLLIYGTDARDYAVTTEERDAQVLLELAWLNYHNGQFTLEGWLYEHLYLYRYRFHWQSLLRFDYDDALRSRSWLGGGLGLGFDWDETVGSVQLPPDPNSEEGQIRYYYRLLSEYQILPANIAGLNQILALKQTGTTILLVEMPVPANYMLFFGQGEADHARFMTAVSQAAAAAGAPFLPTTPLEAIPADGWVDYSHLNRTGAAAFSRWLGGVLVSSF
ncbi:MAG: hypothetical protein KJ063_20805 [Anaerolineae bacterium]|nr:hypothetical protein [Anaerolineae bacterium]